MPCHKGAANFGQNSEKTSIAGPADSSFGPHAPAVRREIVVGVSGN